MNRYKSIVSHRFYRDRCPQCRTSIGETSTDRDGIALLTAICGRTRPDSTIITNLKLQICWNQRVWPGPIIHDTVADCCALHLPAACHPAARVIAESVGRGFSMDLRFAIRQFGKLMDRSCDVRMMIAGFVEDTPRRKYPRQRC